MALGAHVQGHMGHQAFEAGPKCPDTTRVPTSGYDLVDTSTSSNIIITYHVRLQTVQSSASAMFSSVDKCEEYHKVRLAVTLALSKLVSLCRPSLLTRYTK